MSTPLEKFLVPTTLHQLDITGNSLLIKLSYGNTQLNKTGINALLGKMPILKKLTPFKAKQQSMDIDLSCVALDNTGKALSVIWYGNLRNTNHSIRHTGDTLRGAVNFEESLHPQETITVRLHELPDEVHHLVFFVNSEHDLSLAHKGMVILTDDEKHHAQKIDFHHLNADTKAIIAWHIHRQDDDFAVYTPAKSIQLNLNPNTFANLLSQFAKDLVLGTS
ncbi:TerD family protein [Moraxella oblonga]|uniref:TerD family protein n=1 Tax=Moraxella oblonga TaxID=200413 RepID=UPI000831B2F7|nr:TerD family protein [Moraxella oblonga]